MRVAKKESDALSSVLEDGELKKVKTVLGDDSVLGWSVFGGDGVEVASDGVTEMVTAVTSNILDLATKIGIELGEEAPRPSVSFSKSSMEMYSVPLNDMNVLVVRDKSGGFRKEFQ